MLTVDRGVVKAAVGFQEQLVVEASDHLLLCGLYALQLDTDLRKAQEYSQYTMSSRHAGAT